MTLYKNYASRARAGVTPLTFELSTLSYALCAMRHALCPLSFNLGSSTSVF
jgi:hypothetical protein